MKILYNSYHIIDLKKEMTERKEIKGDMPKVIEMMIEEIASNPSSKRYAPTSDRTVVASTVTDIVSEYENRILDIEKFYSYTDEVVEKLLLEELKVQKRVGHLKGVQKGCLVQALIEIGNKNYRYFIAKIEHANFVDGIELILKEGFNPNENKIWKTCIFNFEIDDEICISEASVYVNNKANYWAENFLELRELKSDEKNTKDAWNGIQNELSRSIKKSSPNDYFILRNAVISYFRRSKIINYEDMIQDIFCEYTPVNATQERIEVLYKKLLDLPKVKNFDTNFISKPREVKAKLKSVHKVNKDIDIIIREGISENIEKYKEVIHSEVSADGMRQLIIKITEDEAFRMFEI